MRRLVSVHPIRPDAAERYTEWCQQLRRRRDEFDRSRRDAGIARQVFWLQPDHELCVVRTDADDPLTALERVSDAPGRFDRWYRRREHEVHGPALVDAGHPPELLTDDRTGEIDAHDRFVAFAAPLLRPDRTNEFRAGIRAGDGPTRTRRSPRTVAQRSRCSASSSITSSASTSARASSRSRSRPPTTPAAPHADRRARPGPGPAGGPGPGARVTARGEPVSGASAGGGTRLR